MSVQNDLATQVAEALVAWDQITSHIDPNEHELRFDLTFYAKSAAIAEAVVASLDEGGCTSSIEKQGPLWNRRWLVEAQTALLRMDKEKLEYLVVLMNEIASETGSDFDGWGVALPDPTKS